MASRQFRCSDLLANSPRAGALKATQSPRYLRDGLEGVTQQWHHDGQDLLEVALRVRSQSINGQGHHAERPLVELKRHGHLTLAERGLFSGGCVRGAD